MDEEELLAIESIKLMNLRKQINANSWTEDVETLLNNWCNKSHIYKNLHYDSFLYFKMISNQIFIPILVCTSLSGVINLNLASDNIIHQKILLYITGSINLLATFLTGLLKYYKPDENQQAHIYTSKAYASFYRNLTLELSLNREERQNCDDIIKWAKQEYDKIQNEAPPIPKYVNDEKKIEKNNNNV